MAKAQQKTGGRVQITGVSGQRRNFTLAYLSDAKRRSFKEIARRMVSDKKMNLPYDERDKRWATNCDAKTQKKLALLGVEVVEIQDVKTVTVGDLGAKILKVKRGTIERKLTDAQKRLERFFDKSRDGESIGHAEAMEFQAWLRDDEKLADATVRRTCGYASQIWNYAIKSGLVKHNPWSDRDIPKAVQTNEDRHHIISDEETQKLWNAIDNDEDRIRFVLLRYLGLRAPSEINNRTWKHVDWESEVLEIDSPKTAHTQKGGRRRTPITHPTVKRVLRKAYEKRRSDNSPIVTPLSHKNLTKHVVSWLGRAGLERWDQLLVNFRRTAVTDACDVFPQHVVSAYFGHCEEIIRKHYAKVKAEHNTLMAGMKDLDA